MVLGLSKTRAYAYRLRQLEKFPVQGSGQDIGVFIAPIVNAASDSLVLVSPYLKVNDRTKGLERVTDLAIGDLRHAGEPGREERQRGRGTRSRRWRRSRSRSGCLPLLWDRWRRCRHRYFRLHQ